MSPSLQRRVDGTQWSPSRAGATTTLFVLMLAAFVIESQLAQYVQSELGFRQPYFLFYVSHCSFMAIFPLHLLLLHITSPRSVSSHWRDLKHTITLHLNASRGLASSKSLNSGDGAFPTSRLISLVCWLTAGVTVPSLLWFTAITLASVSDVTAIWNTNAFWAYVLSVKINGQAWERRKLVSVVIASLGVMMVVYGSQSADPRSAVADDETSNGLSAPFIGNVLTLIASFGYGLYQVMYKMYATLPEDSSPASWRRLSISSVPESITSIEDTSLVDADDEDIQPVSFGLYPNFLTSCMGLVTLVVMWIFIPILHYTDIERFALPKDLWTSVCIFGIICTAVTFYMTFMILLGVWGPIVTSVGNLLTIVLVMISDVMLGTAREALTVWSLTGSAMVVCAFGVLAHDTLRT